MAEYNQNRFDVTDGVGKSRSRVRIIIADDQFAEIAYEHFKVTCYEFSDLPKVSASHCW